MVISSDFVAPCLCFQVADMFILTDKKKLQLQTFSIGSKGKFKNICFQARWKGKELRSHSCPFKDQQGKVSSQGGQTKSKENLHGK